MFWDKEPDVYLHSSDKEDFFSVFGNLFVTIQSFFFSESQLQHFWMYFHSYETVFHCTTILHKWHNKDARTKSWCLMCVGACLSEGTQSLRSCSNISKERLDGRRVVWVGLAFNHGKGYANRNLFWRSHFRSPFMDLKKTKTVFLVLWISKLSQ